MSDIDDMLSLKASQGTSVGASGGVDAMLSARAAQGVNNQGTQPGKPTNPYGFMADPEGDTFSKDVIPQISGIEHNAVGGAIYGPGQLMNKIAVNPIREAIQAGLNAAGFDNAAKAFDPVDFDKIVNDRENDYQNARTAAGQTGFDWWGAIGTAANPLNYAGGGAATSILGRVGQAAGQGAAMGLMTPSNSPGSFWQDKIKNVSEGSLFGGGLGTTIEGVVPAINAGINGVRKLIGTLPDNSAAAEKIVNSAFNVKGVDPTSIPAPVISGAQKDIKAALDAGAEDVSPRAVLNQGLNQSLPHPYQLTRGMATEDPINRTFEYNLSTNKTTPQGQALTQIVSNNTAAGKANLDALGANAGHDEVSTGIKIDNTVKPWWQQIDDKKSQLYDSVRNSQGQSALMDGATAAQNVEDVLSSPQEIGAWKYLLPPGIKDTLSEIQSGDMPLTVSSWQALDHKLGEAAFKAQDGNVSTAINKARAIMGNTNLTDDVGQESMQAYQEAKQAHAQQMSMVTDKLPNGKPNPNYQPIVDSIIYGGKAPETLFADNFLNESGSVAGNNKDFLTSIDPDFDKVIGQTLMNHIQSKALGNSATDSSPLRTQVLKDWANGAQKSALMENLLPPNLVQTFRNFSRVHSLATSFPSGSSPNLSGTAGATKDFAAGMEKGETSNTKGSAWADAIKQELQESPIAQTAANLPGIKSILSVSGKAKANQQLNSALNPDVTLRSMLGSSVRAAGNNRGISKLLVPSGVAPSQTNNPPE
jgi:hypothetical protein